MSGQECTEGAKKKRPGVDTTVVLVQQDGEVGEEEEEEGGSGRSGGGELGDSCVEFVTNRNYFTAAVYVKLTVG